MRLSTYHLYPQAKAHPTIPSRRLSLGERVPTTIFNICELILRSGALSLDLSIGYILITGILQ